MRRLTDFEHFALWAFGAAIVPVIALWALAWTVGRTESRTPAPTTLPSCTAYRVIEQADSIAYEVWHRRGERCRLTLPDGATHHPTP